MRVSVILASRLQSRPQAGPECLWLDRSLRSVHHQTVASAISLEIVVGLDPGTVLPARLVEVIPATAPRRDQFAALNAAVTVASGDVGRHRLGQ